MSGENTQNDSLFTPAITPKVSAGSLLRVIVSIALVLAGFWLFGIAFSVPAEFEIAAFAGGVVLDTIGFILAFGTNPASELEKTAR